MFSTTKEKEKFIDSPHFVSKRQITKNFEIKDKFILKWLDETLDDYRILISAINSRLDFFICEQLRDYLRANNKDIDIVELPIPILNILKGTAGSLIQEHSEKLKIA